jgi:hypothetical protein
MGKYDVKPEERVETKITGESDLDVTPNNNYRGWVYMGLGRREFVDWAIDRMPRGARVRITVEVVEE